MKQTIKSWFLLSVAVMLLSVSASSHAVIRIEITKGGTNAIPIAIVPFGWTGGGEAPADIAQIVSDDLQRSGAFGPLNRADLVASPVSGDIPVYTNWRLSGADYLLIGGISPDAGRYSVDFQLFDVAQQRLLSAFNFKVGSQTLRNAAHQIADEVYEEILGIPGAFNTQVAFISVEGSKKKRVYKLQLADADGQNPQSMLTSSRPILSPSWAPDGVRIAYVSFEDEKRTAIFIQDRQQGSRKKIISQAGINGAPAWSPDGKRLAVTLSHEGSPDIYIYDIASGKTKRVTTSGSIDTEPVWMDNNTIVFTSNRSGGPQIYKIPARGGRATRLTFEGKYNASADISPDGKSLAFVHATDGGYKIGVINLETDYFQVVSKGSLDESPSFAPNSQMILYATESRGLGALAAVSLDGSVSQRLTLDSGGVREPSWSPFAK